MSGTSATDDQRASAAREILGIGGEIRQRLWLVDSSSHWAALAGKKLSPEQLAEVKSAATAIKSRIDHLVQIAEGLS